LQRVQFFFTTLPAGAFCTVSWPVIALAPGDCPNTTDPPFAFDGPTKITGTPASTTWTINDAPTSTFSGAISTLWSVAGNWNTPPGNGSNIVLPNGVGLTMYDITGVTPNLITLQNAGGGLTGTNPLSPTGFVVDAGAVTSTVVIAAPTMLVNNAIIWSKSGVGVFNQDIGLNGVNLDIFGTNTINIGSTGGTGVAGAVGDAETGIAAGTSISGTGSVAIDGATVNMINSPTFTGSFQVVQGQLVTGASIGEEIDLSGTGKLSGTSVSFGTISLSDQSIAQLGSANAPATWTVSGPITANPETEVIFNFGSNNTSHSEISSSSTVTFVGSSLIKGVFVATPSAGLTYGPLILAGTLTGCPGEAVGCGPNGAMYEATPVCFLNEVEFKVTHIDTIFKASLENPHEGCP
jgi:hypothetical protein